MEKLCECGCGEVAKIAVKTVARLGHVKGEPLRFINGHHLRTTEFQSKVQAGRGHLCGNGHPRWKGGKMVRNGYVRVLIPGHPRAVRGYVLEHILIAETALGRPLPEGVEVHHVNEVKHDNHRPFNLVICQDHRFHLLLHQRARAYRATGNPNKRECFYCKEWGIDLAVTRNGSAYHRSCDAENARIRRKKGTQK